MKRTERAMRTIELGLLGAIVLAGCSSQSSVDAGGHTNWLECKDFSGCASNRAAVACTDGYCVDGSGKRLTAAAGGSDGGAHRDSGGRSATNGGSGAGGGRAGGGSGGAGTGGTANGGASNGGSANGGTASGGTATGGAADGGGIRMPNCPGPMTEQCASEGCADGGA